jgi:hypothetical protein
VFLATLDRFFCTTKFDRKFPLATVQALPRLGSDHTPVVWDAGLGHFPKITSFKFEKWWFLRADFAEVVEKSWKRKLKVVLPLIYGKKRLGDLDRLLRASLVILRLSLGNSKGR